MTAGALPARVLVLGMGYAGRHVASSLQSLGVACSGSVRDVAVAPEVIRDAEAVLCTVPPDEDGDPVLRLLMTQLRDSPSMRWVGYLSSTAVYADRDGGWVDAHSAADAVDESARRRLLAEQQWRALALEKGIASAVFRLPGLYGRGRNALVQLAEGRARHVLKPGLVFNGLHVEDLATAVVAAMRRAEREALYLPCDDEAAAPQEVLAYAAALGGFEMPPAMAWDDPSLSPALRRFYAGCKRIDSLGTREALQWAPRFATYREGLLDAFRG